MGLFQKFVSSRQKNIPEPWPGEGYAKITLHPARVYNSGLRYAEPEWNWENEFVNSQYMNGLRVDARPSARPLINKQNNNGFVVETPTQITIQFDQVAYAKGGAILKMMQHVITEDAWVDGMQHFLDGEQFSAINGQLYFQYMQDRVRMFCMFYQFCSFT